MHRKVAGKSLASQAFRAAACQREKASCGSTLMFRWVRPLADHRLARANPNRPALCELAEHVPVEAYTASVHLFTPCSHRGRHSRPLLWLELDAWVAVGKEHVLHGRSLCFVSRARTAP
jgi:hypothetical protein